MWVGGPCWAEVLVLGYNVWVGGLYWADSAHVRVGCVCGTGWDCSCAGSVSGFACEGHRATLVLIPEFVCACVCVCVNNRSSALQRSGKVCVCVRVCSILISHIHPGNDWLCTLLRQFLLFLLFRYANYRAERNCESCGLYSVVGPLNSHSICTHNELIYSWAHGVLSEPKSCFGVFFFVDVRECVVKYTFIYSFSHSYIEHELVPNIPHLLSTY